MGLIERIKDALGIKDVPKAEESDETCPVCRRMFKGGQVRFGGGKSAFRGAESMSVCKGCSKAWPLGVVWIDLWALSIMRQPPAADFEASEAMQNQAIAEATRLGGRQP